MGGQTVPAKACPKTTIPAAKTLVSVEQVDDVRHQRREQSRGSQEAEREALGEEELQI